MRTLLASLVLAILVLPVASAGSADNPEAPDAPGDVPPNMDFADFLGVWTEAANGTLTLGVKLVDYQQAVPGACWSLGFRVNGAEFSALLTLNPQTQRHVADVRPADGAGNVTAVETKLGAPAVLRVAVPTSVVAAKAGDVVELTNLRSCYATSGGAQMQAPEQVPTEEIPVQSSPSNIDEAVAARAYSVPFPKQETQPPTTAPPATTPVENTTETPADVVTNTTDTPANGTVNETISPSSTQQDDAVQPPVDAGFLGLPAPGALLVAAAAAVVAGLRRRRA